MDITKARFLEAMKHSLYGKKVQWEKDDFDMETFFSYACSHNVLPMICEAVGECQWIRRSPAFRSHLELAVAQTADQIVREDHFLKIYSRLNSLGIFPVVIKGAVMRRLYPHPYHRLSADEDLLVREVEMEGVDRELLLAGLRPLVPGKERLDEYEVSYRDDRSKVYLEFHRSLFDPGSVIFGPWNEMFEGALDRTTAHPYPLPGRNDGAAAVMIKSLHPTDHLSYMILHAMKHFLHTGFGIRQACDILLFAEENYHEIDWEKVWDCCSSAGALTFARAVFLIGTRYLLKEGSIIREMAGRWEEGIDPEPLVDDILDGGSYGASSLSRMHSSTLVLGRYERSLLPGRKRDRRMASGIIRSVFLPAGSMEGKYPYLRKYPFLLPAAWISRGIGYARELADRGDGSNNAMETVRIAKDRIRLLEEYGIINEND